MNAPKQPMTPLADGHVPVQAKLAAAWTSFMFLYIYVDYFHLYKPGAIDQIRSGVVFEFAISPTYLTTVLALVSISALMIVLSMALPARANRITNLIVAALEIPFAAINAVGESWDWASFMASPSASKCCCYCSFCVPRGRGPARPLRPPVNHSPSVAMPRRVTQRAHPATAGVIRPTDPDPRLLAC